MFCNQIIGFKQIEFDVVAVFVIVAVARFLDERLGRN